MPSSPPGLLDDAWAGLLHCARYVVCSETSSEARSEALQIARTAAERGEACLFASSAEPADLVRLATSLHFDLARAAGAGSFCLARTPAALLESETSDALRRRAFADLTALVHTRRPDVFVLDDLPALSRFDDSEVATEALGALRAMLTADAIPLVLTFVGDDAFASVTEEPSPSEGISPPPCGDGVGAGPLGPCSTAVPDPFSTAEPTGRSLQRGHFVAADLRTDYEDHAPTRPPAEPSATLRLATGASALLDTDLFEHVDVISALDAFAPPSVPEALTPPAPPPPDPREQFVRAFDAALHAHTAEGSPLLAVALRMPPDHPTARRFHFVLRALEQALDGRAALLGDEERCRAVWVMPDAAQDAASPVLDALKHSLREATSEADYMMQNLAVALVPNGHPFPSAATFLAHFFDGA